MGEVTKKKHGGATQLKQGDNIGLESEAPRDNSTKK